MNEENAIAFNESEALQFDESAAIDFEAQTALGPRWLTACAAIEGLNKFSLDPRPAALEKESRGFTAFGYFLMIFGYPFNCGDRLYDEPDDATIINWIIRKGEYIAAGYDLEAHYFLKRGESYLDDGPEIQARNVAMYERRKGIVGQARRIVIEADSAPRYFFKNWAIQLNAHGQEAQKKFMELADRLVAETEK